MIKIEHIYKPQFKLKGGKIFMRKLKVLVADDIEIIAKSYERILSKNEQIEIVGLAYDGQEEYDIILEQNPDIVITDNKMPKLNGVDVIEKIHDSNLDYIPKFIIITGDADPILLNKCNELGVIRVLIKPISNDKILYAVDEVIELITEESLKYKFNENK